MRSAKEKLSQVIPLTLFIILILLYLTFGNMSEALLVMISLPFALVGGFWLIYLLDYNMSIAVGVGFIALAGVSAEFGVIMLVYLDNAIKDAKAEKRFNTFEELKAAIMDGAVLRVRPKAMTVAVIIAGLLPIKQGHGTGSEVMQRIAAPMVGGMITAPLLSLFVVPTVFLVWKRKEVI
jgi:Cu(I)/Ag(I) efflux system membrane protein CusA/SilA